MTPLKFFREGFSGIFCLATQAFCGLFINMYLMGHDGGHSLGVFSKYYAFFVVAGQLCALGLPDSVQKFMSEKTNDPDSQDSIRTAGLFLSVGLAFAGIILTSLGALVLGDLLGAGAFYLSLGVGLFVFNKVGLGILNGTLSFGKFYYLQSLRPLLIGGGIFFIVKLDLAPDFFAAIFSVTELIIFFHVLFWVYGKTTLRWNQNVRDWFLRHATFGFKIFPHTLLSEAFIRIDVIMLSLLGVSATHIGHYSFISFIIEGVLQIPLILRTLVNPRLSALLSSGRKRLEVVGLLQKVSVLSVVSTGIVCLALSAFLQKALIIIGVPSFPGSTFILNTLLIGVACGAFAQPFDHFFIQAGLPGVQSLQLAFAFGLNVILNLILIPKYGITGAAQASALSLAMSAVVNAMVIVIYLRADLWSKPRSI